MKYALALLPLAVQGYTKTTTGLTFPKFKDVATAPTGEADQDSQKVYDKTVSQYFGYRYGKAVFLGQQLAGGGTVVTNGKSFWNFGDVPQDGLTKLELKANGVTAGAATSPSGNLFVVCENLAAAKINCCGGSWRNDNSSDAKKKIPYRFAVSFDNTKSPTGGIADNHGTPTAQDFNIANQDFLLDSMYHLAKKKKDGTDITGGWCGDKWFNKITTKITLTAEKDFGKMNKCTWQIRTSDPTKGMAFKMSKDSQFIHMLVHYVEFLGQTTYFGTGKAILSPTETTTWYEGSYPATAKEEVYLNPIQGEPFNTASNSNTWTFQMNEESPDNFAKGSIGFIGQYSPQGFLMVRDSAEYLANVEAWTKVVTDYNTALVDHNKSVETYNGLMKAWNADPTKDLREVVRATPKTSMGGLKVPTGGSNLDITIADKTTFQAAAYKAAPYNMAMATYVQPTAAWPNADKTPKEQVGEILEGKEATKWSYAVKDVKASNKQGYLESADSAGTAISDTVSHAFGRMSQGEDINTAPYMYGKTLLTSTDEPPTMNLSLFPENVAALTLTQKVSIDIQPNAWMTKAQAMMPSAPNSPTALQEGLAKNIAASALALATVAFTLY